MTIDCEQNWTNIHVTETKKVAAKRSAVESRHLTNMGGVCCFTACLLLILRSYKFIFIWSFSS